VNFLVAEHGLSKARACGAVRLSRATFYRGSLDRSAEDAPVIEALNELVSKHPRWGFGLCFDRLRLDGYGWNHKRVRRVYRQMGLNLPRRRKKRLPKRPQVPLDAPAELNRTWSIDFMSDALYRGRRFRTLNVLDDGIREALRIVIDTSIPSGRVVRELEQIAAWRGYPKALRLDNGPEMISSSLSAWCEAHGVELRFIQPGKPNQNAYVERFNRTYRHEVLDAYLFTDLAQVREITEDWLRIYNEERPHRSLGRVTPAMFRERIKQPGAKF
jgi:putative transposase